MLKSDQPNDHTLYDFVAMGVGPFNLGLACLTEPIDGLNGIFLDKRAAFNWHPGMLLEGTTLQIPFIADLVSMADPTSKFSFLNYLKQQGRMYSFYIRENFLVLREEYNQYCKWVIDQLSNVHFGWQVEDISYDDHLDCYAVSGVDIKAGLSRIIRAKKIVLGTGTVPYVPECAREVMGQAIHSASYLNHKKQLQGKQSITVLGSGQSAAEIYHDLLQDIDQYGYELNWVTRSPRFFPLEYSKLTLEMTSPEYVDYFYNLPEEKRAGLIKNQKHLYKGINNDLIADIFDLLYIKKLKADIKVSLRTNSELREVSHGDQRFALRLYQHEQEQHYHLDTEGLVLATGYAYSEPGFLAGIHNRISRDAAGRYEVGRNYAIDKGKSEIFVQNAELHTHGFVTPDLGMACYRNSYIIQELTGQTYYPVEDRIAFQQFGVSEQERVCLSDIAPVV